MSSFEHDRHPPHLQGSDRGRRVGSRPSFSSQKTSNRLPECESRPHSHKTMKRPRVSIFREEGLDDLERSVYQPCEATKRSAPSMPATDVEDSKEKFITFDQILKDRDERENEENSKKPGNAPWYQKIAVGQRPMIKSTSSARPGSFSTIPRSALIVFLIAVVVPAFRYSGGRDKVNVSGADAGVIRSAELVENGSTIEGRQTSPTDICTRWSHQIANVNGSVYIYGGQAKMESSQASNTWNNDFLTLDLTKSWQISSPAISGLPQPSGPPPVAMGSLWHSYNKLWLYGGMFSDNPSTSPLPVSTWEYDIKSSGWTEYPEPQTSAGNHTDGGGAAVQRSAEGAGLSVPELGKSWYFGGHLDLYTTVGWSNQIARIYLKSMLEFTHPGYANTGVYSLGSTKAAGSGGVYRNITQGGLQDEAGFTERADGVLVYIPGWGEEGIILGLAGGTNETFTEMNIIDVYDVANSTWYKQSTSGTSPGIRVNPCAVVAAAPDGSSFNIYLYGGQNLIPYGSQIQYSDIWILTIPSFTWIKVDLEGQSQPPPRAGHSCTLWDGQMVVVGGYVGKDISCDSPGIYVFNASSLQWSNSFTSLSSSSSGSSESGSEEGYDSSIISGSVGFQVPEPVQSIIGGGPQGGATATTPAAGSATAGPIATGKPPTFTVTQSGSIVTQTAQPPSQPTSSAAADSGTNIGAITAGSIAAVLAILAGYLAFCTWLYRRQLKIYKNHVAIAQRTAFNNSPDPATWGSGSATGSAGRMNEKVAAGAAAAGVMLGPFGTEIGRTSGSAGRPSVGESSGSGPPGFSNSSDVTPGSVPPLPDNANYGIYSTGVYGGGSIPGGSTAGKGYGSVSEEDENNEYQGATWAQPSGSTAHSSTEDLLGGQEPSFFSVILNPRRTLRVVNSD